MSTALNLLAVWILLNALVAVILSGTRPHPFD